MQLKKRLYHDISKLIPLPVELNDEEKRFMQILQNMRSDCGGRDPDDDNHRAVVYSMLGLCVINPTRYLKQLYTEKNNANIVIELHSFINKL